MKPFKIALISLVFFFLILGFLSFSLSHGKMYMDRIMAMSEDGETLFISDMIRTEIIGPWYRHSYQFSLSVDGKTETKFISFNAFSPNIQNHENLIAYTTARDHETTVSSFQLDYKMENQEILSLEGGELVANFVTKTHPEYFRYVSNGTGQTRAGGISKNLLVLTDAIISHDASYAYLRPGTEVQGYMGGYWDDSGNMYYIDISKMIKRGPDETYEPHSYLLSFDRGKGAKKIFSLEVTESGDAITFTKDTTTLLEIDKRNLRRISERNARDAYYTLVGTTGSGALVRGFLNLVR